MNLQQLFYLLGSIYLILCSLMLVAMIIVAWVLYRFVRESKRKLERRTKVGLLSSGTAKALIPIFITLVSSWSIKKLKNTLTRD